MLSLFLFILEATTRSGDSESVLDKYTSTQAGKRVGPKLVLGTPSLSRMIIIDAHDIAETLHAFSE